MTDNLLDIEEVLVQKIEDARFITRRQEYIKIHVRVKLCNKNCIVYLQTLLTSEGIIIMYSAQAFCTFSNLPVKRAIMHDYTFLKRL